MATRALLALGLELLFLGSAFGWRSVLQWRRTGSTGFVRPRRDARAVELAGSVAFVVALVLLVAAPVASLVGVDGVGPLESAAAAAVGLVLGVLGIAITVAAQVSMGVSWRVGVDPDERTELITSGVFTRVRNPVFSAMILAAAGLVLLVPNVVSVAALTALVVGVVLQVVWVEEPYLHRVHGRRFDDYRARSGRFVPRRRRRTAAATPRS